MASFTGESVWRHLGMLLRRKEKPDESIETKLGRQWDALCEAAREHVEGTGGNACVQTITVTIKTKAYRTENNEIAMEITPRIKGVIHDVPLPTKLVYLDHDGVAHTAPIQNDLPIMGIRGSVDGGKKDERAAEKVGSV